MTPRAEGDRPRPVLLLLSGPNLALLGERQPEIYGTTTLAEHVARAGEAASRLGCELRHLQSDHESELIEAVHSARGSVDGDRRQCRCSLPLELGAARRPGDVRGRGGRASPVQPGRPGALAPRLGARTGVRRDGGGLRGTWLRARGRGRRPPLGRARRQGEPGLTCRPRSRGAASRRLAPSISADAEWP